MQNLRNLEKPLLSSGNKLTQGEIKEKKEKQAGAELCQAQAKLI